MQAQTLEIQHHDTECSCGFLELLASISLFEFDGQILDSHYCRKVATRRQPAHSTDRRAIDAFSS